jgi:hypothetical protein
VWLLARWQGGGCPAVVDATGRWRSVAGASRLTATVSCGGRSLLASWPLSATALPSAGQVAAACDLALHWARILADGPEPGGPGPPALGPDGLGTGDLGTGDLGTGGLR